MAKKNDGFVMMSRPIWKFLFEQKLTQAEFRVLSGIVCEHLNKGGQENGRLIVTKQKFMGVGIHHDAIAPAVRGLVEKGLVKQLGAKFNPSIGRRSPYQFQLTFLSSVNGAATHDYLKLKRGEPTTIAPRPENAETQAGNRDNSQAGKQDNSAQAGKQDKDLYLRPLATDGTALSASSPAPAKPATSPVVEGWLEKSYGGKAKLAAARKGSR